jgi:tetratricopeptide (TPR) repeat protein
LGGVLSSNLKDSRLEMLRSFADKRPQDPFPRYALGMELKASGDGDGAWGVFESLITEHADYIASYAPAGEVLAELGRLDDARAVYGKGIEACSRRNDAHTRDHLESALEALSAEN